MYSFLTYMDWLKENFITYKNTSTESNYGQKEFYFYRAIKYIVDDSVSFNQSLWAVKLAKTQILFIDKMRHTKVYFSDMDIIKIIGALKDLPLKEHIQKYLQKILVDNNTEKERFLIQSKMFEIKAIPFSAAFNDAICCNPADLQMNGNDLIALIDLILEKDRTDSNPNKVHETAQKYLTEMT